MRGGIDPGDLRFRPRIIPVVDVWNNFGSGDGNVSPRGTVGPRRWAEGRLPPRVGYMSVSQLANSQLGWSFHTLRGGIDPGDLRFRPRVVGGVEMWNDF